MDSSQEFAPQPDQQSRTTMRNWKLTLSYDGTDYRGWQIQPGQATIQGELQSALGRVTGESPLPQGSGRTDAGVHALGQVASFELQAAIPADNLLRALNRTLPRALRVLEAKTVPSAFHARHSTVAKTYEYRVYLERPTAMAGITPCSPFLARFVYPYPWPLDLEALQTAAQAFIGTQDFVSFAATDPDAAERELEGEAEKTTVRTIYRSGWESRDNDDGFLFIYRVRGSGFLHHMVRNLVGTMLDMGRGYRRPEEVASMIAAKARSAAGPTAPASGLFLRSVEYAAGSEG